VTSILRRGSEFFAHRPCEHVPVQHAAARADACEECGSRFKLRVCSTCGHVGCCDSQQAHARDHSRRSGHPVMYANTSHGRGPLWCYVDNAYVGEREGGEAA
jgi:CPA1 family monovalent cation:H+ antiporter